MAWWFFFPIAFFVGFVFIVVMIVLAATTMISGRGLWSKSTSERSDSAFQIIRERYAKDEITKEQFEQMTKDLGR